MLLDPLSKQQQRRIVMLHLCFPTRDLIITNVYAPNSPNKHFFQRVSLRLVPYLTKAHLIGGDFNTVMNTIEDRSTFKPLFATPPTEQSSPLSHFINSCNL